MKTIKAPERILQQIKTEGPKTASELGKVLGTTSMGARQHLEKMEADGLVSSEDIRMGVGRPRRVWKLSERGHSRFPDRHDNLTVEILISIKDVFGEKGLNQLIDHKTNSAETLYRDRLNKERSLENKIKSLVQVRSDEGYMADYERAETGFLFLENHCPICAAATACQNLCRSELELFQRLFKDFAEVKRLEHIIHGARRCAYSIIPL